MWAPILIILAVVAILAIGIALYNSTQYDPGAFLELLQVLDCCSAIGVYGITFVIMIGGFMLWHSLLVAALVGAGIMTVMLIVVSVVAASYKAGSQSSLS